jgi:glutathione peroxidase-family protein
MPQTISKDCPFAVTLCTSLAEKTVNISLGSYRGSVLLVVNLASFWGYTPQYYSLNALMEKYAGKPFKILGFPCNQFAHQVSNSMIY